MSSVKISVSVICYLCVYISLGDAALATIRVLKMGCYWSQNAALQIAQNGLGGLEGLGGLTGYGPAGGPEFPPSCGSGPVAVGSGLWGRSQLNMNMQIHQCLWLGWGLVLGRSLRGRTL